MQKSHYYGGLELDASSNHPQTCHDSPNPCEIVSSLEMGIPKCDELGSMIVTYHIVDPRAI